MAAVLVHRGHELWRDDGVDRVVQHRVQTVTVIEASRAVGHVRAHEVGHWGEEM